MVVKDVVEEFQSIDVEPATTETACKEAEAIPTEFAVETEVTASKEPGEPQTTATEFTSEGHNLAPEIVKEPVTIEIAWKPKSPQQRV